MARAPQKQSVTPAPFAFGCDVSVFPASEVKALERLGARFEAIASGTVHPTNAEEEHFLLVEREAAAPRTVAERAWVRLKGRREYEREQERQTSAPPSPPENYGMVEFDADRCWW